MARIARVVVAGYPHHLTQRGNRRQQTFFNDGDYQAYIDLMAEWFGNCAVEIWSYCLMPNHTHLIAVPSDADNLVATPICPEKMTILSKRNRCLNSCATGRISFGNRFRRLKLEAYEGMKGPGDRSATFGWYSNFGTSPLIDTFKRNRGLWLYNPLFRFRIRTAGERVQKNGRSAKYSSVKLINVNFISRPFSMTESSARFKSFAYCSRKNPTAFRIRSNRASAG